MAFQQGLSGLNAASKALDVTSNNVANSATVGFKSGQAHFADIFANSLAGTGNSQTGIGTSVTGVQQQFTQGNITTTNNSLDISINGSGFYRMSSDGAITYSRSGQFHLDKSGYVIDDKGRRLTGYLADSTGTIVKAAPQDLLLSSANQAPIATGASGTALAGVRASINFDSRIAAPVGVFDTTAAATANKTDTYNFSTATTIYDTLGNSHTLTLYASKVVPPSLAAALAADEAAAAALETATAGAAEFTTAQTADTVAGTKLTSATAADAVATSTVATTAATAAAAATTLTTATANKTAADAALAASIAAGDPAATIATLTTAASVAGAAVTAATTAKTAADTAATAAVAAQTVTAAAVVAATATKTTTAAALVTATANKPAKDAALVAATAAKAATATSVATEKAVVYATTDWTINASVDGTATVNSGLASQTLTFDQSGNLVTGTGVLKANINLSQVMADQGLTNSAEPMLAFDIDFAESTQFGSAFGTNSLQQDGYTSGRLVGVGVDGNGVISGNYSNGQARQLGQVALASFTNPNGLTPLGGNQWAETSASGSALVGSPNSGALGVLQASSVEESNVDLTAELVNMITEQRNYQANAQSIKTQDQVLNTLVNLR